MSLTVERPGYARLWFGFLGAPFAWMLHELIGYPVMAHACYPGLTPYSNPQYAAARGISLGVDAVTLVIALAAMWVAFQTWRAWQATERERWQDEVILASARHAYRYLAFAGVLLGAIFAALIVYSGIALVVLQTCSY